MKRMGFGIGVATALALVGVGACHDSKDTNATAVCSILCPCIQPHATGDELVACIASCESSTDIQSESPACQECVFDNGASCGGVETICGPLCDVQSQMPSANVQSACALECNCQGGAIQACETSCDVQITEACATCLNADGTCQAATNCVTQCQ